MVAHARMFYRRAIENGAADLIEREPANETPFIIDDEAAIRRVIDAFFRRGENAIGTTANEWSILFQPTTNQYRFCGVAKRLSDRFYFFSAAQVANYLR
jgi:hypothetical protein